MFGCNHGGQLLVEGPILPDVEMTRGVKLPCSIWLLHVFSLVCFGGSKR